MIEWFKRMRNKGKCWSTMHNLAILCNVYFKLWQSEPTHHRITYGKIFLKLHRYYCCYMTRALK